MKLQKLVKRFDDLIILDDFSLTLPISGNICFMAPSGSGKTTLFRMIAELDTQFSGNIVVDEKAKISLAFQENRLLDWLTVEKNVQLVNEKADVRTILTRLYLLENKDDYPPTLSGGMRQRVNLARAIAYGGDVFIFDEPFQGFDDDLKESVGKYLSQVAKDKLLLFSSHSKWEAARFADMVHVLSGPPLNVKQTLTFPVPVSERGQSELEEYMTAFKHGDAEKF